MNVNFSYPEFYKELESFLPTSSAEIRRIWATTIIEKDIDIKELSQLLKGEQKIATRFLWLLSEIGTFNQKKLLDILPFLLDLSDHLDPNYKNSFASFWRIVGVPLENEGIAIDLLFQWLLSPHTNVTIKTRSLFVLYKLTKKYPELKNELKLCLEDLKDKYSKDFEKRANKILITIGQ
ncbi:MAG TPA: hypothetical protein VK590_01740 [Saprospiraceae bacterium]|nr:hypothetical protein [Saprospiraceae bacterium]